MAYSYSSDHLEPTSLKSYAVVIYLPPELAQSVARLRERFDPDYNLVAAHVTLVFPFETEKPLFDLTQIIQTSVKDLGPLEVELSSVDDF